MSIGYVILFFAMLIPAFIAMAFASRHWLALVWNFTWFLILAKVGLKAFDSEWGAFPALMFAINYAVRAMRATDRPKFNVQMWNFRTRQTAPSEPQQPRIKEKKVDDVIEAEFREL